MKFKHHADSGIAGRSGLTRPAGDSAIDPSDGAAGGCETLADLERAIEILPGGAVVVDHRGRIAAINRCAERLLGYEHDELRGQSLDLLVPEPARAAHAAYRRELFASGESREMTGGRAFAARRKDGSEVPLYVGLSARETPQGRVVLATLLDITESKETEDALRRERDKLSKIAAVFPGAIFSFRLRPDGTYCFPFASAGLARIYGLQPADVVDDAAAATARMHPDDVEPMRRSIRESARTLSPWRFEFRVRHPERGETWVEGHSMPVRDADGSVLWHGVIDDVTERKRAQAELEKERGFLQTLLQNIPDPVFLKDPDGVYLACNPSIERLFRRPAAEIIGKTDHDIFPTREADHYRRRDLATIAAGTAIVDHEQAIAADGRPTWLETIKTPMHDAQGHLIGVLGIARDITALRQAQETLRERLALQEQLATIAATAPGAIASFRLRADGTMCFPYASPAITEIYGLRPADLAEDASALWTVIHPEDAGRMSKTVTASARTLTPMRLEFRVRHPIKGEIWIETNAIPQREADGATLWHGISTDVTERKRAEASLRQSEARFATIFHANPISISITTPDGRFIDVNDAFLQMFGYAREEVIGRTAIELGMWARPEERDVIVGRLREEGSVRSFETQYRKKSGDIGDLQVSAERVELGGEPYLLGLLQDIGERKRSDEAIRRLNAELERRVAQRTAELEAANKDLEAFSYSVSHDLRAPLRAVDGFSRAVLEDFGAQLPEEGRRHLELVRRGAQRMGELIDDLLAFARLGRQPLNTRRVDTNALVREALEELGAQRQGRRIDLRVADLPACQADAALLKQVWVNLLSNAFKYTRRHDPAVVEIGCTRHGDEDVYFVRDNGAGFDMQYAGKLFGVFQRLHRAEDYEGTGVGLAVVQRIVRRHGGRVWAEAAVDRGATFSFTLAAGGGER